MFSSVVQVLKLLGVLCWVTCWILNQPLPKILSCKMMAHQWLYYIFIYHILCCILLQMFPITFPFYFDFSYISSFLFCISLPTDLWCRLALQKRISSFICTWCCFVYYYTLTFLLTVCTFSIFVLAYWWGEEIFG